MGVCVSLPAVSASAQTFGGKGGGNKSGDCTNAAPGSQGGAVGQDGNSGDTAASGDNCGAFGGGGGGANGGLGGDGSAGNTVTNGRGGAGGAGGALGGAATGDYTSAGNVLGGAGQNGFDGTDSLDTYEENKGTSGGGGGGGGAGGFGLEVTDAGTITNDGYTIQGGDGGNGGVGGNAPNGTRNSAGVGGNGGDGGIGIWLQSAAGTVVNSGQVLGGKGGDGGLPGWSSTVDTRKGPGGDPGAGGAGIYNMTSASVVSLTNSGTIKGGDAGASNTLEDGNFALRGSNGNNGGDGVRGVGQVNNSNLIQGGNGSNAGNGSSRDGYGAFDGARGGKGGAGIDAMPVGSGSNIKNSGRIIAGRGGNGGDSSGTKGVIATSGNGGNGGTGIAVATRSTVENDTGGLIQGGDGGNGGHISSLDAANAANAGNAGNGGYGIDGAGITVRNSGTIIAGQAGQAGSGTAVTIGNIAVHFGAGGTNMLELRPGSDIQGNVVAERQATYSNIFVLGGDGEGILNGDIAQTVDGISAYQGFTDFRKTGSSTWTLQGSNDGNWTISGGTLQVGDGGHLDEGSTIHTSDGYGGSGFLSFKKMTDATFGGFITGDGGFRQAGDGTITLTNYRNNYTGDTELNAGEISIFSDDVLGDPNNALSFNGGLLKIIGTDMTFTNKAIKWGDKGGGFDIDNAGNTFVVDQVLDGDGGLTKAGLGTLVLTGANTYSGITTITSGVLKVGDGGANGALGSGDVTNNGSLVVNSTGEVLIQGKISGTGTLEQAGSGTTILASDNDYIGDTTISDGVLQLGNGGTTGSVGGDIINNKKLIIDRADDAATPFDFENKTIGSGEVVVAGSGTVKFTNEANDYSGGTVLESGTLQIGSDAVLGDSTGGLTFNGGTLSVESTLLTDRDINVATNAVFDVDATVDLTLKGALTGNGVSRFDKSGPGRLILDPTAGTSGFMGTANVNTGVMLVDSDFGGSLNVNSGGTLGGEGSVGATMVAAGGTLAGAFGKTLKFNNDLVLAADGTVQVVIGATPNGQAMFDVSGNLELHGTLDVIGAGQAAAGIYHVFDYHNDLDGNGFSLGNVSNVPDPNSWQIQTANQGEINLINTGGVAYHNWDGSNMQPVNQVAGGSGTWNATNTNWTDDDGANNGFWDNGALAIFTAAPGTVAVDGSVSASGLIFQTDGYIITGDPLTLVKAGGSAPVIQVGAINLASKDLLTATIDTVLEGQDGLNKTGNGKLILKKDATYTGVTTVSQGTLQLGDGGTEGSVETDILLAGNHFDDSILVFDRSDDVDFHHSIDGIGEVIQRGTGVTTFYNENGFSGGLTVEAGTAKAGVADTAFGSGRVGVEQGATLDLAGFNETIGGLVGDKDGDGDILLGAGTLTLNQDFDDQFSGAISGTGGIVKNENGKLTLFGTNNYSGETILNDGFLVQGAQGAFSNVSAYTVAKGSTLDLNGFSTNMVSLNSVGKVDFGGTGGTQLTIAGDYIGGGTLVMNTVLGTDSSETDMLRVAGNTSGTTTVVVNNPKGGLGAATVNGIELIDIAGNSGGAFNLQGNYTTKDGQQAILTSSAYAYTLQKGDASGSNTNDWYLVSQYTRNDPDGPNPPACDDPNGCPENPSNPSGPSRFSPAAPVYTSYAASMQALNQLPTLQQRRGDRYLNKSGSLRGSSEAGETDDRAIWARIEGAHNRLEPNTTAGHVQQDINTVIMQAGVDGQFYEDGSGRLIAGITGQYGNGRARTASNFDDVNGGGELNTQGWGLGGTVTWYGNDGFYVDGQAQANWYKTDLRFGGGNNGLTNDNNGFGYAFSVETGKRFDIDENWSLTPQAQLMFSSVDFDTFSDSYGATVSNRDGNSLNGRLGLAANYANSWQGADSRMVNANVYGIANLYQEFLGGTSINYGGTRMKADQDRTWAGVGFGGTYAWADNKYSVHGEGTVNTSLNHFADSYAVKGNVGFKVNW